MADRPILFSAPMVRALLDGRKTMTRRILNPGDVYDQISSEAAEDFELRGWDTFRDADGWLGAAWLRYAVGDRLWVRETWCSGYDYDDDDKPIGDEPRIFFAASECPRWYDPNQDRWLDQPKWRPSIFMPRPASRLTLNVTAVKVERLQDITEADARAEGCKSFGPDPAGPHDAPTGGPVDAFALLWDSINGPGAWAANPWVAAISFDVVKANIDAPEAQAT